MATAMKRLGVYLGLVEDEPGYDYGYQQGSTAVAPAPVVERTPSPVATLAPRKDPGHTGHPGHAVDADLRTRPAPPTAAFDPYAIHTIHPRSYNDARRIGEEYRAGSPVIMNLSDMGDGDAKRIVDFAAGLVFAMHGSIERVTQKVFLLSPANVDVRDAPAVQQARDGFFNQS